MTTIRSATPNDVEALAQLKNPATNAHRALFASIAHERIMESAHKPLFLLVAEEVDGIVGQVLLRLDGSPTQRGYPSIQDLHVLADKRGQGIGTALLQRCETLARERRYADISIAVNPTLNPRALALYERLGYRSTGAAPYLGGVYDGDEDWIIDLRKPLVALHPAASTLATRIRAHMSATLGDTLVGLYLYGSLVSGDYDDGVSDIDLLAAIRHDLTEAEYAALDAMHHALLADAPEWNDRIEIAYLSLAGLQTFKTQDSPIYVISPGEPFNAKTAGREWLMNWHLVRERGLTLYGPPPTDIIAPTSQADYVQCIREHALAWREWVKDGSHIGFQSYAILTMSRALYTITTGEHPSKQQAAVWAQQVMPEWAALIEQALRWRLASREPDANQRADATLPQTHRFVYAVTAMIEADI